MSHDLEEAPLPGFFGPAGDAIRNAVARKVAEDLDYRIMGPAFIERLAELSFWLSPVKLTL